MRVRVLVLVPAQQRQLVLAFVVVVAAVAAADAHIADTDSAVEQNSWLPVRKDCLLKCTSDNEGTGAYEKTMMSIQVAIHTKSHT